MPLSAKPPGPDAGSLLIWQILGPIAAVLFALAVLSGIAARQYFEPLAMERDLQRAERYAKFSAVVFGERLPGRTPQELTEEFHAAGLETLEFLPVEKTPRWESPRFLAAGPFVEAWSPVIGVDGTATGAVMLRRQADAVLFVTKTVRHFAIAACLIFAVLLFLMWLLLKRRVTERLKSIIRDTDARAERSASTSDVVEETRATFARAAERSRKERDAMAHMLDSHSEMACKSTPDGTILSANGAYARFFGKTTAELAGTNYLDLIPPADRAYAVASVRKLSHQQPINHAEHRVLLRDGAVRWIRWRDTGVFDETGKLTEVLSFGTDISGEKQLAERIEGMNVAFEQMQSLAETGSVTWDFAQNRMDWTPETRRLLGADPGSPASLDGLLTAVAPEDREVVRQLFLAAKEAGRDFQQEFRAVLPDGSLRHLQSRAEVLADPKTRVLNHLTCTLRDITALRDAEAATKRELRLREAIEQSVGVGIVVSDEKGTNLLVNPAFCAMTGWREEELVGVGAPYPYWPPEEIPAINRAFELAIAGKTPSSGFELKFLRKDGSRFDVLVKVAPLLDSNDLQLGWLGAVTDISALQGARRELQIANERMHIAQDIAEFGIWDWDPVADTLYWDRNSFSIFGQPQATDPKEVWRAIHGEEEQERLTYELKRLIAAGGKSGQDLLRARWPDGSIHEVVSTYVVLRDAAGTATRVLGVNRDVTAELETERELHNAQERLAAALEGGQFGTFEHVIGLGDVNWNQANYEINGIDPAITEPAKLFSAWKNVAGDFFPTLMAQIAALPVGENHFTYEFTAQPAGLEPRRIRVSIYIERNSRGHPTRFVGVTRRVEA